MSKLKEKLDKIKEAVNKAYKKNKDLVSFHNNISNVIDKLINEACTNFNKYYNDELSKITFKDTKLEKIKTSYKTLIKKIDYNIEHYSEYDIEQLNSLKSDLGNGKNTFTINEKYTDIINKFVKEEFTTFANSVTNYDVSEYKKMQTTKLFDGLYNDSGILDLSKHFIKDNKRSILGYGYSFNNTDNIKIIYKDGKIVGVRLDSVEIPLENIDKVSKFSDLKIFFLDLLRSYYTIYTKIGKVDNNKKQNTTTEFNNIINNLKKIKEKYDKKEEDIKENGVILTNDDNNEEIHEFNTYFEKQYIKIFSLNTEIKEKHYEEEYDKLKDYILEIKNNIDLDSYLFGENDNYLYFNEKIEKLDKFKAYDKEANEIDNISYEGNIVFSFLNNIEKLFKDGKIKSIYQLRKEAFDSKQVYGYDVKTNGFNKDIFLEEIEKKEDTQIYKYVKQALGEN